MRKNVATKLKRLYEQTDQTEDWEPFIKYLKKCNESELREAFGDNKNMLINIVYSGFEDAFDYVTEDFIKQMFVDLQKDDKEYLQEQINQDIYYIADDIYNDNKNALKYFSEHANYIFKVGSYIKYCNPINERIAKQYWFIMNQAYYYMNTDRLFE